MITFRNIILRVCLAFFFLSVKHSQLRGLGKWNLLLFMMNLWLVHILTYGKHRGLTLMGSLFDFFFNLPFNKYMK